jgi:basic amino acid/polyamine antiporter, APA family
MTELRRTLGLASLSIYGIGVILGAGIYSIIGAAAGVAGEALWQAFALAGVAAALSGLSYAELSTMFPRAGAEYVYLREAWPRLGWLPGTLGWVLVAASLAIAATIARAFAGYAAAFTDLPSGIVAAALLAAVTGVAAIGMAWASKANAIFTVIETAGIVAVIVVGLRAPGVDRVLAAPPNPAIVAAAGLVFFAYLGFEELANLAEEARWPDRDLPRAILISVAVSTTLYVLVSIAVVALLPPADLAASQGPLAAAIGQGAPRLVGVLEGIALIATANTALITVIATSRLLFSMARGGNAPPLFGTATGSASTPVAAVVAAGVGSVAMLPLGGLALTGSVGSLLSLLAFAAVNSSLIRLRVTRPDADRPFRTPFTVGRWPVLPVLGLGVVALLLSRFDSQAWLISAVALAAAVIIQGIPWAKPR